MNRLPDPKDAAAFVRWMREASPYMRAHRGHTFVIHLAGELVDAPDFPHLVQDLSLLVGIGVRLVLVHGTRPQLAARLAAAGLASRLQGDLRVTDAVTLSHARDAAAQVRFAVEAQFAHATRIRPPGADPLRITSGNFVMARPAGIIEGVDLQFTGEVRRIDTAALEAQLEAADVVLVSPLGYSPTGELFSLRALDLACEIAQSLKAAKLILLTERDVLVAADGHLVPQLTLREAKDRLAETSGGDPLLKIAVRACHSGVERVHLLAARDGALLLELFSRDGVGTLISDTPFDQLRQASIEDVGGILDLIEPLEAEGVLVKRSREKLETEIDHFMLAVRDGATLACAALYPYPEAGTGEIAGVAVDPAYRRHGFGRLLMEALETRARELGLKSVFVLTTQAHHWFMERGYEPGDLDALPGERRALYNYQRNSQVLTRKLR